MSAALWKATCGDPDRLHGHVAQRGLGLSGLVPLLARHGIEWIATDEESWAARPGQGRRMAAATSAIPSSWTAPGSCARANRTWRSFPRPSMSDQVGFRLPAQSRTERRGDSGKLRAIGDACRHNPATLVLGHSGRRELLDTIRRRCVVLARLHQSVAPRSAHRGGEGLGEFVRRHPPQDTLPRLSREAGSATTSRSGSVIPKHRGCGRRARDHQFLVARSVPAA